MTDTDAQPHAMPFLDHPETAEAGRRITVDAGCPPRPAPVSC